MAKGKACLSCGSPLIAIASARWISKLGALEAEAALCFSTAQSGPRSNLTFILNISIKNEGHSFLIFIGGEGESIFVFLLEALSKEKPRHDTQRNVRHLLQNVTNLSEIYFSWFFYSNTGRKSDSLSTSTLLWSKGWCEFKVNLF